MNHNTSDLFPKVIIAVGVSSYHEYVARLYVCVFPSRFSNVLIGKEGLKNNGQSAVRSFHLGETVQRCFYPDLPFRATNKTRLNFTRRGRSLSARRARSLSITLI